MTKPKSVVLTLRISEDEQAQLRDRAEVHHKSVSEFVRGVVQDRISPKQNTTDVSSRSSTDLGSVWVSAPSELGQTTSATWLTETGFPQANSQTLIVRAPGQ